MLDTLAPQMPQAKNAKPEQFVDISFLNEVGLTGNPVAPPTTPVGRNPERAPRPWPGIESKGREERIPHRDGEPVSGEIMGVPTGFRE